MTASAPEANEAGPPKAGPVKRILPWVIAALCFGYLYWRIDAAAAREGQSAIGYLAGVFASVSWGRWLALMVPYSIFFFLVDSLILWRVVNWFNARVAYTDLLPVRASTYILSILNEQVGKGAMALYLNRREGVPGWQLGSSMLFIMFCEFFYLLGWATLGTALSWERLPEIFHTLPFLAAGAAIFFVGFVLFFRSPRFDGFQVRERHIVHAFRQARPWQYLGVVALRSPALLAAVFVYSSAARLFGVDVGYVEMLGYLPVIFFGASMPVAFRGVAITLWVTLFPDNEAQMAAFGFVQHNFFILFNAAIGLLFLRRANRELFGAPSPA